MTAKVAYVPATIAGTTKNVTRLIMDTDLGVQHPILLQVSRVSGATPRIEVKIVGMTIMMMDTWPWVMRVISGESVIISAHSEPELGTGKCRPWMPDIGLTEFICLNFWRSKALQDRIVLRIGS